MHVYIPDISTRYDHTQPMTGPDPHPTLSAHYTVRMLYIGWRPAQSRSIGTEVKMSKRDISWHCARRQSDNKHFLVWPTSLIYRNRSLTYDLITLSGISAAINHVSCETANLNDKLRLFKIIFREQIAIIIVFNYSYSTSSFEKLCKKNCERVTAINQIQKTAQITFARTIKIKMVSGAKIGKIWPRSKMTPKERTHQQNTFWMHWAKIYASQVNLLEEPK